MVPAFVFVPAVSMIARMMAFFPSRRTTMKIISFSAAMDTPRKRLACSIPVPLAWITVPPAAWAFLAASIIVSV